MNTPLKNIGEVEKLRIITLLDDNAGHESPFWAQHGISLLLDVAAGGMNKKILLDTGQLAEPVLHNMKLLGVEPNSIDMIFISHCHYDHTGGITGILKQTRGEIPVVAHPSLFRENFILKPCLKNIGITQDNTRDSIIQNGGCPVLVKHPFVLMEGVVSTGEVERVTDFEPQGIGTFNIENGRLVPDVLIDDMSLVVNIKDKGLFIVSGCSHAGIVNIIKHAVKITGINKVYGLIGGLHLKDAKEERIDSTISALSELNLQLVAVGHCTGLKALCRISKAFGERFTLLYSGKVINL